MTNSSPLPKTLLMSPLQGPQPPRNLGLPVSRMVSRAPGGVGRQEQGRLALCSDPRLPLSEDFYEISLDDSVERAPAAAREGSPHDNPTAQQIVQLPPVMQDTQEHPGLPSKPCIPFFYQAAKNREINIIII